MSLPRTSESAKGADGPWRHQPPGPAASGVGVGGRPTSGSQPSPAAISRPRRPSIGIAATGPRRQPGGRWSQRVDAARQDRARQRSDRRSHRRPRRPATRSTVPRVKTSVWIARTTRLQRSIVQALKVEIAPSRPGDTAVRVEAEALRVEIAIDQPGDPDREAPCASGSGPATRGMPGSSAIRCRPPEPGSMIARPSAIGTTAWSRATPSSSKRTGGATSLRATGRCRATAGLGAVAQPDRRRAGRRPARRVGSRASRTPAGRRLGRRRTVPRRRAPSTAGQVDRPARIERGRCRSPVARSSPQEPLAVVHRPHAERRARAAPNPSTSAAPASSIARSSRRPCRLGDRRSTRIHHGRSSPTTVAWPVSVADVRGSWRRGRTRGRRDRRASVPSSVVALEVDVQRGDPVPGLAAAARTDSARMVGRRVRWRRGRGARRDRLAGRRRAHQDGEVGHRRLEQVRRRRRISAPERPPARPRASRVSRGRQPPAGSSRSVRSGHGGLTRAAIVPRMRRRGRPDASLAAVPSPSIAAVRASLVLVVAGCGTISTSPPAPTPADFQGIATELTSATIAIDDIVSGDAGCDDRALIPTAIGFDGQRPGPGRARCGSTCTSSATGPRSRSCAPAIDACARSFVTDPRRSRPSSSRRSCLPARALGAPVRGGDPRGARRCASRAPGD